MIGERAQHRRSGKLNSARLLFHRPNIRPPVAPPDIHVHHRLEPDGDVDHSLGLLPEQSVADAPQNHTRVPSLLLRHGLVVVVAIAADAEHHGFSAAAAVVRRKEQHELLDVPREETRSAPIVDAFVHGALEFERRCYDAGIELEAEREIARAVHRAVGKLLEDAELLEVEIVYDAAVGERVRGGGDQGKEFRVELSAGDAEGVQGRGGGVGELDGDDPVVLAESVRLEEFAAEDCEGFKRVGRRRARRRGGGFGCEFLGGSFGGCFCGEAFLFACSGGLVC